MKRASDLVAVTPRGCEILTPWHTYIRGSA